MNEQQLPQPYSKFKQPIEDLRSELYSADFLGSEENQMSTGFG